MDPSNEKFDSQEDVYDEVGTDLLDNSFQGYNACIFAYGQTGGDFKLFLLSIKFVML